MITENRFSRQFLSGAIALAIVFVAASLRAEEVEQVVTVISVHGNARYSTDHMKSWHKLRNGEKLAQGTMIQTAEDGNVNLVLGERSFNPTTPMNTDTGRTYMSRPDNKGIPANVVHLFPSTIMVVDKLTLQRTSADDVSETQLDLRAGKIAGNVKKLSGGSRYEVKIPNGVAGIRGTQYLISASGEVYVLTGSVVITYVDQNGNLQTTVVTAGNAAIPQPIGPPIITPLTQAQINILLTLPTVMTGPGTEKPGTAPGIIVHISPN